MQRLKSQHRSQQGGRRSGSYERSSHSNNHEIALRPKSPITVASNSVTHLSLQRALHQLQENAVPFSSTNSRSFSEEIQYRKQEASIVYMDYIAALEIPINNAIHTITERSSDLSKKENLNRNFSKNESVDALRIKPEEVDSCWFWIQQLARMSQMHISFAAAYHKFWFDLSDFRDCLDHQYSIIFSDLSSTKANHVQGSVPFECRRMYHCLKDHLSKFTLLSQRMEDLIHRSRDVHPIHFRLPGRLLSNLVVKAVCMCSCRSSEGGICIDEEVELLDNMDRNVWKVKTNSDKELDIPSICLAILGPDHDAIDNCVQMLKEFVGKWEKTIDGFVSQTVYILTTLLKHFINDKYSIQSDKSEHYLIQLLYEIENDFIPSCTNKDFSSLSDLIVQVRKKFHLPLISPHQSHHPNDHSSDNHKRFSICSVSSLASVEPSRASTPRMSLSNSNLSLTSEGRVLRDAEMAQPRLLLYVLMDHITKYRKLDSLRTSSAHTPSLIVTPYEVPSSAASSNVFEFSNNHMDSERLVKSSPRYRMDSASSNVTGASTYAANEEIHSLMMPKTNSQKQPQFRETIKTEPKNEDNLQVTTMHLMINEPTKFEKHVAKVDVTLSKPMQACFSMRNHLTKKQFSLDSDNGAVMVTQFEPAASKVVEVKPKSVPMSHTGSSWTTKDHQNETTQTNFIELPIVHATSEHSKPSKSALFFTMPASTKSIETQCDIDTHTKKQQVTSFVKTPKKCFCVNTGAQCSQSSASVSTHFHPTVTDVATSGAYFVMDSSSNHVHASYMPVVQSNGTHFVMPIQHQSTRHSVESTISNNEMSTQTNFEIELTTKIRIRNHNLEDLDLISVEKHCLETEHPLTSLNERMLLRNNGLKVRQANSLHSTFSNS